MLLGGDFQGEIFIFLTNIMQYRNASKFQNVLTLLYFCDIIQQSNQELRSFARLQTKIC
jgi:hypothetical protein